MSYNAYALKSLLQKEHIVSVLDGLGAHGINDRDPNGIRSSCPIHQSSGTTVFVYSDDKHLYNCYGECTFEEKDGDIIKLVQVVQKCTFDDACELICEWAGIDSKLVQDSDEWVLEELQIQIDNLFLEIEDNIDEDENNNLYYGVKPIPEESYESLKGLKDEEGFIDNQGFKDSTLTLFESGYSSQENRWLLPQRSPDGILLGFDGRDTTNKRKDKWKKRAGLLKNKLLGRLDLFAKRIEEENKIIIAEGKKDQMALYEAGYDFSSCIYGSSLAKEQKELLDSLIDDEIIICPDGDKAGYKMVQSIVKLCYPEYNINVMEIPDNEDVADLSKKYVKQLYDERIPVEVWLKRYEYRNKEKKKK